MYMNNIYVDEINGNIQIKHNIILVYFTLIQEKLKTKPKP